ncbi:MAG TPA: hypothetical protein G4O08_07035 [Anaerolineae bacterium]|nr:hypothetical protein [Anaerolineae bacterium]
MSMKALNHLVARSIVDPSVVISFNDGRISDVLSECEFAPEMRANLAQLEASSFAEYAMYAYRIVKAAEEAEVSIKMPSPLEGLLPRDSRADQEQVA